MGRKTKSREAQKRAAEAEVSALLRAPSKVRIGRAFIDTFGEFAPAYRDKIEAFRHAVLRVPETWRCRLRTRAPEKRFLDLVRYTFARYGVAPHLESVWIDEPHAFAHRIGAPAADRRTDWNHYFRFWHIVAAQGGSLYKNGASNYMSKLETHHFLTAPDEVTSPQQAFWYAFARAQTQDAHAALRIARTKLVAFPIQDRFWTDAARYFARNPVAIPEMNDLIDFFQAALQEDANFSLRGRTLAALQKRMREWHRMLRRQQLVCGGRWDGLAVADVEYEAGSKDNPAIWRFRQIKTGNALFQEGRRMHHCVVTYKYSCVIGAVSIWSLTCEFPRGKVNRGVTLEVKSDGTIVQCRGFANRQPHPNEKAMVKLWAADHGLAWMADE